MPLHDWTDERGWDSVHPLWLTYLLEHVQERLPPGYKAFLGGVPALTVDVSPGRPDVSVRQRPNPGDERATSANVVNEPDVELAVAVRLEPQRALHIDFHGQLVAALELVSPRNKDRHDAKEGYCQRYLGYLRVGVHLLLIDVLPRPKGFSFADRITQALGMELEPLPAPFSIAFRIGETVPVNGDVGSLIGLWRRAMTIGQPLPSIPLPLSIHQSVLIDLETTYQRAAKRAYLD